jgi:hypothetical protein
MTNISTWAYKYQTLESVEQFTLPMLISQWEKKEKNRTKSNEKSKKTKNSLKTTNNNLILFSWLINQLLESHFNPYSSYHVSVQFDKP